MPEPASLTLFSTPACGGLTWIPLPQGMSLNHLRLLVCSPPPVQLLKESIGLLWRAWLRTLHRLLLLYMHGYNWIMVFHILSSMVGSYHLLFACEVIFSICNWIYLARIAYKISYSYSLLSLLLGNLVQSASFIDGNWLQMEYWV